MVSNEPIEVTVVTATLSMCAFWKKGSYEKFHDADFFAREVIDDCLQVRISKSPCSLETACLVFFAQVNLEDNSQFYAT